MKSKEACLKILNGSGYTIFPETTLMDTMEKFSTLYEYYNLDIGDDKSKDALILKLAAEIYPAFQVANSDKKPVGRPRKDWTLNLYADVLSLQKTGKTGRSACNILAKRDEYKGRSPESLNTRLREFKKTSIYNFFSSMREEHDAEEIDQLIIEYFSTGTKNNK